MLWFMCLLLVAEAQNITDRCVNKCYNVFVPKLNVSYQNREVECNQLLTKEDTEESPMVRFQQGVEGSQYLLLILDPDALFPCAPPEKNFADYVHYAAIVSSKDGLLDSNNDLIEYGGPRPPIGTHRYQFYLYNWSQSGTPNLTNSAETRSRFNREMFENENCLGSFKAFFQFRVTHAE